MAVLRIPVFVSIFHADLMRFKGVPSDLPYEWNLPPDPSKQEIYVVGARGRFKVSWRELGSIMGDVEVDAQDSRKEPRVTILRAVFYFGDGVSQNPQIENLTAQGLQVGTTAGKANRYRCVLERK